MSKARIVDVWYLIQELKNVGEKTFHKISDSYASGLDSTDVFGLEDVGNDMPNMSSFPQIELSALQMPVFSDMPELEAFSLEPSILSDHLSLDDIPSLPEVLPMDISQGESIHESVQEESMYRALPQATSSSALVRKEPAAIQMGDVLTYINQVTGLEPQEVKSLPAGAIKITLTIQQPEYAEV